MLDPVGRRSPETELLAVAKAYQDAAGSPCSIRRSSNRTRVNTAVDLSHTGSPIHHDSGRFSAIIEGTNVGEVRASVVLENGDDRGLVRRGALEPGEVRRVEADALVDTGAVLVFLPQDMVEALGLGATDKAVVTLANDQKVEIPIAGPLVLTALGRTMNTDCLVGPPRCEPLLGQVVLERLDLIVDSTKRQLIVRPESPFLPSLKAK